MPSGRLPAQPYREPGTEPRGAEPTVPRAIGPYELLLELGRGSAGAVFLGRRPGIDRLYAVKLIRRSASDPELEERFRREARVSSRIDHPGIVHCLDVGTDAARGLAWLAMDFVPGRTVRQVLDARQRLEPIEAAELIAEVAEAVGAAHAAGIVHRDLKPANLLVDSRTGRTRVTDFGLARDLAASQALTRSGDVIGTPAYMAPEQLSGRPVDARADVWALGAMLHELLVGERPIVASSVAELAAKLAAGKVEPPSRARPGIPAALDAVCLGALRREPRERFADGGEMARALKDALVELRSQPASRPAASRVDLVLRVALAATFLILVVVSIAAWRERARHVERLAELTREHRAEAERSSAELVRAKDERSALQAGLDGMRAERDEARREREALRSDTGQARELEAELRHAVQLQVEARDRTGQALAWVLRELESPGGAAALRPRILLHLRRHAEVLRLTERVPDGPEGVPLLALRVRAALEAGERPLAQASAKELLARAAPESGAARLAEMTLGVTEGRGEATGRLLSELLRAPPDDPDALGLLARLVGGAEGGEGRAIELSSRALDRLPADAQLLQTRAVLHWSRWLREQRPEDLERSLRDLLRARDVIPLPASDWLNTGICLVSLGLPRAAIPELEEAVRQEQGPPSERNRARTWLGNAWARLGDEERAERWWSEAVRTHRESASEMGEHLEICSPELRARMERAMAGVRLHRQYRVPPR